MIDRRDAFEGDSNTASILTALARKIPAGRAILINFDGSWRLADADHRPSLPR